LLSVEGKDEATVQVLYTPSLASRLTSLRPYVELILASALIIAGTELQAQAPAPQVFGPDQITDVYRVSLDRGALLLESIDDVLKTKNIRDGQVVISSG
jgi:hypothetical protein